MLQEFRQTRRAGTNTRANMREHKREQMREHKREQMR